MRNPFLGRRYRLLEGAVEREIRRRWGLLPLQETARRLGLSVPTLRRMLRSEGVYNDATLRQVEDALSTPRILLAAAVDEGGEGNVPDMSLLSNLPAAAVQSILRTSGGLLTAFEVAGRARRLVHWALGVRDQRRPHRQLVHTGSVPFGGAYAQMHVDTSDGELDLVVSMILPLPMGFDIAIDFGWLRLGDGSWRSDDIIGREVFEKRASGPRSFITFAPAGPGVSFLMRGSARFDARLVGYLGINEGEERLGDASDPLVGFRARGLFHVAGDELPWAE